MKIFATISFGVAVTVPTLVVIFANSYSESPFGYAPQMFLVMAIGLAWAILNLCLGMRDGFRSTNGKIFVFNAFISVSPTIYYIAWNMFIRQH